MHHRWRAMQVILRVRYSWWHNSSGEEVKYTVSSYSYKVARLIE